MTSLDLCSHPGLNAAGAAATGVWTRRDSQWRRSRWTIKPASCRAVKSILDNCLICDILLFNARETEYFLRVADLRCAYRSSSPVSGRFGYPAASIASKAANAAALSNSAVVSLRASSVLAHRKLRALRSKYWPDTPPHLSF
jgi:hypothetical protein